MIKDNNDIWQDEMRKGNKTEQQVFWINIVCLSTMIIPATILVLRFNIIAGGCASCFSHSLANKILSDVLAILIIGYLVSIPVMIHRVRRSRRGIK